MAARHSPVGRRRHDRRDSIGKISAPFVKDTSVIVEKFVDAVKDLFQYCYTDDELYSDIRKMDDQEMFASLSEYLEDIKFGIFEALSDNLDKISMKFLQLCDKQDNFDKYLKVLKERWRNSSSMHSLNRHDDKHIRSAKQYINKLAANEAAKSKSPRRKSPIKPQVHNSEYSSVSRTDTSKPNTTRNYQSQSVTSVQDMPLNESRSRNQLGSNHQRMIQTPARELYSSKNSVQSVVHPESPRRSSARKASSTYSGRKIASPARRSPSKERSVDLADEKMIVKRTDYGTFNRDILDPKLIRNLYLTQLVSSVFVQSTQTERSSAWSKARSSRSYLKLAKDRSRRQWCSAASTLSTI